MFSQESGVLRAFPATQLSKGNGGVVACGVALRYNPDDISVAHRNRLKVVEICILTHNVLIKCLLRCKDKA